MSGSECMLKITAAKSCVSNRNWWRAAAVRAIRTLAQAMIAGIGTSAVMGQVDWKYAASAAALAGVLSVLTSMAGIPEVKEAEHGDC